MYRVYRFAKNYLHDFMGFCPKFQFPSIMMGGLRKTSFKHELYYFLSLNVFNWNFFLFYDGRCVVCGNYLSSTGKRVRRIYHIYSYIRYISYTCLRHIKYRLHRNSPGVSVPQRSFHKCVYGRTIIIIILLVHADRL